MKIHEHTDIGEQVFGHFYKKNDVKINMEQKKNLICILCDECRFLNLNVKEEH